MTDEFRLPADDQPVLEEEQPSELIPDGEPTVYDVESYSAADTPSEFVPREPASGMLTLREWLAAIFGSHERSDVRINDLSQMIEHYPDVPANYVFRGELLLKTGNYEQASEDFQQALTIASEQIVTANWGLVAQAVQNRALDGLEKAQRHLKRKRTEMQRLADES